VPFRTAAARERFEEARLASREQRGDASRPERRGADTRTADLRQSRMDERRNGSVDRRDERGTAASARQSLTDDRGRAAQPENRRSGENRSLSDNRREADTRPARPEPRGAPADRDSRSGGQSERPSGGERRGDRIERGNDVTRFRARSSEPPFGRPEAPRTASRAESQRRAYAPGAPSAQTFADRRAQPPVGGYGRATPESRFVPHGASTPRTPASAPAPRMHAEPRGGGRQEFGGGARRNAGGRS
jgi:hypothetical protein